MSRGERVPCSMLVFGLKSNECTIILHLNLSSQKNIYYIEYIQFLTINFINVNVNVNVNANVNVKCKCKCKKYFLN